MQITVRNDYRIEVVLSAGEMDFYGITYEEMDYSDAETRRMLWSLVNDIKKLSGFSISLSGRLLIEVMKEKSGNTRICFTGLESKSGDPASLKQLVKSEPLPLIAEFEDIENVITLSLCTDEYTADALYEKDGKYRVLFFADEAAKEKLETIISEYGCTVGDPRLQQAVCLEKWNCVIRENALYTLRKVFSEKQ